MSTIRQRRSGDFVDGILYSTEHSPMESGTHLIVMTKLGMQSRQLFRRQDEVYASDSVFVLSKEGNPAAKRCQDAMLIKGVPCEPERISYKAWYEKVPRREKAEQELATLRAQLAKRSLPAEGTPP